MAPPPTAYRIVKWLLVFAALVAVAAAVVGDGTIARIIPRLPEVSFDERVILAILSLAGLLMLTVLATRLASMSRSARRVRALERATDGVVTPALRNPIMVHGLRTLFGGGLPRIGSRIAVLADLEGISLWGGAVKPRLIASAQWSEVRTIRADSIVVGDREVSVMVLRIRRGGTSAELPIALGTGRAAALTLGGADFFARLRQIKSWHRAEIAATTGSIPIIRPEQLQPAN
ncbi:hypothetical protein ARHIZOSPH14_13450 [Agromyces rhizosphaerae]|uniref:Uncharacterized protein n=1 Tax=Agromyces rhizosphaerae TaxID=88374 RepID=A0A9W6CRC6_9MICO|nr:hypothetical protein [Agromyces rhizosphaerae]GLI27103.1 hypothetical protein ARHIZOSPH14_13450 [Agromyces rhizosphaerae]